MFAAGLTAVTHDIRYLKTRSRTPLLTKFLEWISRGGMVPSLPFLYLEGLLSFLQYREQALSDPKAARLRRALKSAQGRLKAAQKLGPQDHQRAAGLLSEALTHFLADKFDQPASGLTLRQAQELLRRQTSLDPGLAVQVRELWEELDLRRFAPASPAKGGKHSEEARLASELAALFKRLDRELEAS